MGPHKIDRHAAGVVTLKALAEYVSLTPGTVSNVLNNAPSSIIIRRRPEIAFIWQRASWVTARIFLPARYEKKGLIPWE
jgi:hypothetical protein